MEYVPRADDPRGIRNNNPGNIRKTGISWEGETFYEDRRDFQKREAHFEVFNLPSWGIRAICKILDTYQEKYNLQTPFEIASRWAPREDDNDPSAYARALVDGLGYDVRDRLPRFSESSDPDFLYEFIANLIQIENGKQPYEEEIWKGMDRAGWPTYNEGSGPFTVETRLRDLGQHVAELRKRVKALEERS